MSEATNVQIVRGSPDELEVAALVAGLTAQGLTDEPESGPSHGAWADRAHGMRSSDSLGRPGPDAWRWSLRG